MNLYVEMFTLGRDRDQNPLFAILFSVPVPLRFPHSVNKPQDMLFCKQCREGRNRSVKKPEQEQINQNCKILRTFLSMRKVH